MLQLNQLLLQKMIITVKSYEAKTIDVRNSGNLYIDVQRAIHRCTARRTAVQHAVHLYICTSDVRVA